MTDLMRKPWFGAPVLLLAGLALTGCNDLNGVGDVGSDDDGIDPGSVVGDAPAPKGMTCAYPVGSEFQFGVAPNMIVPVNRQWQGYSPNVPDGGQVNIADYYDCDGSRNIDAIMVDVSQYG